MDKIATLNNFSEYQNAYYKKLLSQPYFPKMAVIIESFLQQIIQKGSFYVRVPMSVLPEIIRSGRLKNTLESSGRSATIGGIPARIESTEYLFGVRREDLADRDYPKFGYLSCSDPRVNLVSTYDMSYQYGEAVIRLKKERLFDRTTISVGSSMDFGCFRCLIPSSLNSVKATCLGGLFIRPEDINGPAHNNILNYAFFASKILQGVITTDNFHMIDELLGDENPAFKYFELQYHGDVTLNEDFESIEILCDEDDEEGLEYRKEASELLKGSSVQIKYFRYF